MASRHDRERVDRNAPPAPAGEIDAAAFTRAFGIPDPGPDFHDEIAAVLALLTKGDDGG